MASTPKQRPAAPGESDSQRAESAVADDLHRFVAPVTGPDEEHRYTDSGIDVQRVYDEDDVARGLSERLGEPGEFPYTRGIHERMYRDRLWTMRQYAGFATAEETNERYRYLTEHGSTGLSMAFDLPTQLGRDSDDPLCAGEVGRTGGDPAAALRARRRGAGRRREGAARDGPERRPQGVHLARQLHLPAGADDAADDGHLLLLRRERPEVEHDFDLRIPHP